MKCQYRNITRNVLVSYLKAWNNIWTSSFYAKEMPSIAQYWKINMGICWCLSHVILKIAEITS